MRVFPANSAETTIASKCAPSPSTTTSQSGRPVLMSCSMCFGVMAPFFNISIVFAISLYCLAMTMTLKVNPSTALLEPIRFLASPHYDERPAGMLIDLVVIHGISLPPGEFGTGAIEAFFCGHLDFQSNPAFKSIEGMRVSSHLLIKRTGEIIQFVPFEKRAWHAGQSSFAGRSGCNDFSIGIELEGTDTIPYELVCGISQRVAVDLR